MIELKIANRIFRHFGQCTINLKFDSVASTFELQVYFNPDDATEKTLFMPGSYHRCEIFYGGVLVLTGTVLSHSFGRNEVRQWANVSGYSVPGILEDTCVLNVDADESITINEANQTAAVPDAPLQLDGLTLQQLCEKLILRQGIGLEVDQELKTDTAFNAPITKVSIRPEQSIASVLDEQCRSKNVLLSHTKDGKLLLTRAKADALLTKSETFVKVSPTAVSSDVDGAPEAVIVKEERREEQRAVLADFTRTRYNNMGLQFDGQRMHRVIQVVGQASVGDTVNTPISACVNPYVPNDSRGLRFKRVVQRVGDENDTQLTARQLVGDELKNIKLMIGVEGWTLGGNLITPNQIVEVQNEDLHLYKKSKWFIQEVSLMATESERKAMIQCVPPEAFNNDKIVNKFL